MGGRSAPDEHAGARIEAAFAPLRDLIYSHMSASIAHYSRTSLVWRLELAVPCNYTGPRTLDYLVLVVDSLLFSD